MNDTLKKFIENAGWPRVIIGLFLASLFVVAPFVNVRVDTSLSDTLVRVGMNGVLVLAMVPMVQSGCGLNFGLPLGIIAGLLGAVTSLELQLKGGLGFLAAMGMAIPLAALFGYAYGKVLNRVKGDEMMIATYVGFSSVAFMCIMWLLLPFNNPKMVWGFAGSGLRTTISTEGYYLHVLNDFLKIQMYLVDSVFKKPYTLSMKLQGKSQFDLAEIHFLITLYGKNFDELFYDKRLEQQTA